jgi:hypothetical protein
VLPTIGYLKRLFGIQKGGKAGKAGKYGSAARKYFFQNSRFMKILAIFAEFLS